MADQLSAGIPAEGMYVQVVDEGPYRIFGAASGTKVEIANDADGTSWEYRPVESVSLREGSELCRCGQSSTKPFCDSSHVGAGVDVTETAGHIPYRDEAESIEGPEATLLDKVSLCAFARFCDAGDRVWTEVTETGDGHRELTTRMVSHCAGGRLTLIDNDSGIDVETLEEQSISFIEDPTIGKSGPIMLRGGVLVVAADGQPYEVRNRQALCRCGRSSHKPFCDASHAAD
jgi:CDGSH-type Zn-finger protein